MSRERQGTGCLGCLSVLALTVGLVVTAWVWAVPPSLQNVVRAFGRHTLSAVGIESPDAQGMGTDGLGYEGRRLSERLQDVYLQILAGVNAREASFAVYDATADDIDPAYKALVRDHPELFWLDGSCTYTYGIVDVVTLEPGLAVSLEQVDGLCAQIDAQTDAFFAQVPADADDYDVARAAYEYVVSCTDYVPGAAQNQNIQSVFIGHASVCAGYARAFQYLMHLAGIPCMYVEGTVDGTGEEHAWCIACLDGVWTNVDPTWGDPAYTGTTDQVAGDMIIYDYLCLTTDELRRDRHTYNDLDLWPTCDETGLDYYRLAGTFFDTYDGPALDNAFRQQAAQGNKAFFKFGNAEAFRQAADALAAGTFCHDALLDIAQDMGSESLRYSYVSSDTLYIVKLYW